MVKHVFCIKDELVGFMDPVYEVNSDLAIRKFKYSMFSLLNDEDNKIGPVEDFNLYEIGTFNYSNAEFVSCVPKLVYTGSRVLKEYHDCKYDEISVDKKDVDE